MAACVAVADSVAVVLPLGVAADSAAVVPPSAGAADSVAAPWREAVDLAAADLPVRRVAVLREVRRSGAHASQAALVFPARDLAGLATRALASAEHALPMHASAAQALSVAATAARGS